MTEKKMQARTLPERLAAARAAILPIKKTASAKVVTKTGGSYSYSYAPLDAVLDAVVPALASQGLALTQPLEAREDGGLLVVTEVRDPDGEVLRAEVPVPPQPDPQRLGAWVTYGRRYTLASLLAIATEEDTDAAGVGEAKPAGKAESGASRKAQATPSQKPEEEEKRERLTLVSIKAVKLAKEGTKKDGTPWRMWALELGDGKEVTTFSSTVADLASSLAGSGKLVNISLVTRGKFTNASEIEVLDGDEDVPF